MTQLDKIIQGGYCIGCGACAAACPSNIRIIENKYQKYEAEVFKELDEAALSKALNVCPFSNEGLNEDEIGAKVFDPQHVTKGNVIGYYSSLWAGHVVQDEIRLKATSGGMITWTLDCLLRKGLIDAVIHVKQSDKNGSIFEYGISKTTEDIVAGAKSRYYPVELSQVMQYVKENDLRYAFVGLPCFVKSARKFAMNDETIKQRLKYFVGLVCGHLKSKAFADYVGWQAGVDPKDLKYVDFRHKIPERAADSYGIRVVNKSNESKTLVARETLGTNWGLGYFKYEACDYCDDIFSETADIAVGDAWLKHYTSDSKGNSVVVVRNKTIDKLIAEGIENSELNLDKLDDEEMRKAQGGGFRHRRVALGYRLYLKKRKKLWFPNKRVAVNKNSISKPRKLIFNYRVYLRDKSAEYWLKAKQKNDYTYFEKKMKFATQIYQQLLNGVRIIQKLK